MKTLTLTALFLIFSLGFLFSQSITPCNYPNRDSIRLHVAYIDTLNGPKLSCYLGYYLCETMEECLTVRLPDSVEGKLFVHAYGPDAQTLELLLIRGCDSVILDSCKFIANEVTSFPRYEIWLKYYEPDLQLHICGRAGTRIFIMFKPLQINRWVNLDTCLHNLDTMCPPVALEEPINEEIETQRYILLPSGEIREILPEKGTIYYDRQKEKKFLR